MPLADASAVPTLLLARMAGNAVTVALSGTGGDELFAGYYRHRAHRLRALAARVPGPVRRSLGRLPASRHRSRNTSRRLATSYLVRLATAEPRDPSAQYMALVAGATSGGADAVLRFVPDRARARRETAERYGFTSEPAGSMLDAIQEFDLRTYLPGDLLVKEDRATMHYSVEARVPLLDNAVVAVAQRVSPEQRATLLVGKRPLRRLAARRLGGTGVPFQKRGFAVPLTELFRGRWRSEAREWFGSIDSEVLDGRRVVEAQDSGALDAADVWAFAALAGWEQRVREARRSGNSPTALKADQISR